MADLVFSDMQQRKFRRLFERHETIEAILARLDMLAASTVGDALRRA